MGAQRHARNLSDGRRAWPAAIARLRELPATIVISGARTRFDPALLDRTDQLSRRAIDERMVVLAIGGVDPTGASGLAADLRTSSCAALHRRGRRERAHRGRTRRGVRARWRPVDLAAAVRAVLDTMPVRAVKIGMLADGQAADARALAARRSDRARPRARGERAAARSRARTRTQRSSRRVTVVTPNAARGRRARRRPGALGSSAPASRCLLKGGHGEGREVVGPPARARRRTPRVWRHPRLDVRNTRGTGCTLASAIAAGLALGESLTAGDGEKRSDWSIACCAFRTARSSARLRPAAPPPRLAASTWGV
jgi:hydroxymethylpyrimidine/phosphomethylpyrimidine kinase